MKKDIKFSTRMASADREKIKALAMKAHMSMSDYVTACCLGKRIVVIDEPATSCHSKRTEAMLRRKNAKREFLSPPPTGLPPKPSEAASVGRGRATESASPAACGGTRDSSSARTTASIAFVWSAAKPLPCQMHWAGHGPTPPSCGQKPTPTFSYDWRKT